MDVESSLVADHSHESYWPALHSMQRQCMRSHDVAELGFVIVNEAWHFLPYRQASMFIFDRLGEPVLTTVSGLTVIQEETPFTLWLGRACRAACDLFPENEPQRLRADMLKPELADGWVEWWPSDAVFVPLTSPTGRRVGVVMLVRETPWEETDIKTLEPLAEVWGYCAHALVGQKPTVREVWQRFRNNRLRLLLALLVASLLCIPVRLTAQAPAEIIPLQAEAVAAPMDGVIKTFHVPPNSPVKTGQVMFSLDDTTLRNRREVALKSLAVARADAQAAQQKSFDNTQSRSELATLFGKVREKEAELIFLEESLTRIDVKASLDGVLVYGDPNDWLGKPVVTGERVAQLAQPDDLGVLMWLPVGDAINLEAGAEMRVFLQVAPLTSLQAVLVQSSYQASVSPDGVVAYRVRGRLESGSNARVGLRGVAKVYGDAQPIIYWLARRPLGALRQWFGV